MRTSLLSRKTYIALILPCVLFATLAFNQTRTADAQPSQDVSVSVTNETKSFQVVNFDKDLEYVKGAEFLRVSLRNDYDKAIVSYVISTGKNSSVQVDFMYSEGADNIAPGEVTEWRNGLNPAMLAEGVTIQAVVFDDGTGDGDPVKIKEVTDQWAGGYSQISRILSILDSALKSPDASASGVLYELETQVASLSIEPDDTLHPGSKSGLHTQRETTVARLKELRDGVEASSDFTPREGLVILKERLESYQVRLRAAGIGN